MRQKSSVMGPHCLRRPPSEMSRFRVTVRGPLLLFQRKSVNRGVHGLLWTMNLTRTPNLTDPSLLHGPSTSGSRTGDGRTADLGTSYVPGRSTGTSVSTVLLGGKKVWFIGFLTLCRGLNARTKVDLESQGLG